jgi:glutamyl-tRNA reductase
VHIDSLSAECEENSRRRAEAVPAALDILDAELTRLNVDLVSRSASPTIKALTRHAEGIRSQNLDWAMSKLDDLDDRQRKVVEDLSLRIIKGLLQAPIEGLKGELATRDHRQVVARLFQLEEQTHRLAG